MRRLRRLGLALLCCLAISGCSDPYTDSGPSDEISSGQLCIPDRADCPTSRQLDRGQVIGANEIDYRLVNLGAATRVVVRVKSPDDAAPDAGDSSVMDSGETDAGSEDAGDAGVGDFDAGAEESVLAEERVVLDASEVRLGRFTQDQLETVDSLVIEVACDACEIRLEYTFASVPLECRSDTDCSGPWVCLEEKGRCVECRSSDDCPDPGQTCRLDTNSCEPPDGAGCSTSADAPMLPLAFLVVGPALLGWRRRRTGIVAAALLVAMCWSATASAAPPRASFGVSAGPRVLVGELGPLTKRGIGLQLDQELRWRHVGMAVSLGSAYFLTLQDPPPLSREFQIYSVGVGPRGFIDVWQLEIAIGGEFRHFGVVSNSLIRQTGPQINYRSVGGVLEVRYELPPVELGLRGGFHTIFDLDSSVFSVDLVARLDVL